MTGAQFEQRDLSATSTGNTPAALLPCASSIVAIRVTQDDRHLIAIMPIAAGSTLFTITGRETRTPTRYSVQVGPELHLDQKCARSMHEIVQQYFWRFMNHSCDPSTVIRDRVVIALRDLRPGDAVTFDYNTTEEDMAEPFACHCRTTNCVGTVRGARHLSSEQLARLAPLLPAWLRD